MKTRETRMHAVMIAAERMDGGPGSGPRPGYSRGGGEKKGATVKEKEAGSGSYMAGAKGVGQMQHAAYRGKVEVEFHAERSFAQSQKQATFFKAVKAAGGRMNYHGGGQGKHEVQGLPKSKVEELLKEAGLKE